jgi:hypothetical protein
MAYNNGCSPTNCTRLPYWSNPDVTYNGAVMGVPEGSFQAADNRKTLNNTAFTVANFRDSGGSPPATGPLVYNSHIINDDNLGDSSGNSNGIAECGETIELFTSLFNQGGNTATGVNADISTTSAYVTFPFNTSSGYPDIGGSSSQFNNDDFDFQIAANAPDDHPIQFTLDVTAGNGGPWSVDFIVPVTCTPTSGDSYEPDNDYTQANPLTSGAPQTHSIYPAPDHDWLVFNLVGDSSVVLETSGTPGDDTRMWLYDNSLVELDYNDDIDLQSGIFFSRILQSCLPAGTYYVKIDEYFNNDIIGGYDLSLNATACLPGIYLPVVIK